jgi:hypothetical protein
MAGISQKALKASLLIQDSDNTVQQELFLPPKV